MKVYGEHDLVGDSFPPPALAAWLERLFQIGESDFVDALLRKSLNSEIKADLDYGRG